MGEGLSASPRRTSLWGRERRPSHRTGKKVFEKHQSFGRQWQKRTIRHRVVQGRTANRARKKDAALGARAASSFKLKGSQGICQRNSFASFALSPDDLIEVPGLIVNTNRSTKGKRSPVPRRSRNESGGLREV